MSMKLYYDAACPASRASVFTLITLSIPHVLIEAEDYKKQRIMPDFLKKVPTHSVPVLEEGLFYVADSHAINIYLVEQFVKNSPLYPSDPMQRAVINERLFFEAKNLYPIIKRVNKAIENRKLTWVSRQLNDAYEPFYAIVEDYLEGNKYIAGNNMTIADLSYAPTLTTMDTVVEIPEEKYPNTCKYLKLCRLTIPNYDEVNPIGLSKYRRQIYKTGFIFSHSPDKF